ncbi:MAG: ATP-binding cassette domain-containing protein [Selenomonadaceae bacterium]|nr:ATP-binding cassette domain-containing protein [Selenomonadaceae bacterium]MBR6888804.1 ATP-binding cassette domain-containing protein [Selenomonadaceae bacterium]
MSFKRFFPAIVANLSAALSEILLMASSAWLIASAALHPPLSSLSIGITLVRTAGISRAALRYADRFISHKIIFKLLDDLREKIFLKAAKIFPLKSGRAHEGELLHDLTVSADLLKDFLPRVVLPLSTAALVMILLTFFLREPLLPIIFLANLIPIALKAADDSDYREKILDFNDGRDELTIFGTKPAIKMLNQAAKEFGEENFKLTARKINFDTAFRVFNTAGFFFMLLKLSEVVDTIALTVWTLIFLATLEIFAQIPPAIRTWKKIRSIKLPDEKISAAQVFTTKNAVEIKNLSFKYADEKIFDDFSLKIERGEKIAVVGESGAGKTTLLYLLMKLFVPNSGTIAINGKIEASTFTNYIFSASIRENFKILHENITDEEILSALRTCELENFDINAPIGEDGANLSGGERNRLQVALAMAKDAEILILDEPTAGLDRKNAEKLIENLILATKNRTLIVITHDSNYFSEMGRIELVH